MATVAAVTVHVATTPAPWTVLLAGALILVAEYLQLRHYTYRGHGAGLNLMEGILAPLVYMASGAEAMAVCVVALATADIIRRLDPIKIVFNVAQWTLAAALASLVIHSAGNADSRSMHVAVLVAAIAAMSLVNHVTITAVLVLAARAAGQKQSRADMTSVFYGRLMSNLASLTLGVALVAMSQWTPALLVIGFAFVIGLDAAGRANASLRADHARLEGMQLATHGLAASLDASDGLRTFLVETRAGFEVQCVELVLFTEGVATVRRCDRDAPTECRTTSAAHPLASELAATISVPARVRSDDGSDSGALVSASGHDRVLAAPLRSGGSTIGVLLLYDRIGMEGFEDGELKIADALGREIVSFLERVELLSAIDEERRKLADILGATSDGIFSIESDGTITSWNAGLASMTGYPAEEVVGTRHFGLLRPRDALGRDVLLERWAEFPDPDDALPRELQIVSSDGAMLWVSCSYSRMTATDNQRAVLVVVARNITQARELERLKDDFVAVVSHELRTPLVPIKGWAQTLLNRGDRLSEDQRRTAVQSILAQAQKLESLVLNILEASRIEAGRSDADGAADVASIAARLVEDTLSSRPERVIRLRPPSVPCMVKGSTVWVERAVSNLIANAIKYSPDDEPVDVVITAENDEVLLAVTDRGPGIAAEAQERIFERFERLEETRKQTGTGLGLYITRRLARAMGGDVTVTSVPGAGSTFLLRLPLARVTSSARLPEQRPGARKKTHDPEQPTNVVQLR